MHYWSFRTIAAFALILVGAVLFSLVIFSHLFHVVHSNATSTPLHALANVRYRERKDFPAISVLLQRSVVDTHKQCERLEAADATWASWTASTPSIEVLAVMPSDAKCSPRSLQSIRVLRLSPPLEAPSPFVNLFQAMKSWLAFRPTAQWLVLGNDHSFFIPSSLQDFLAQLDSRQLVYTGNRLALRGVGKGVLHFASGGAGAVLSAAPVKLMIFIWTVNAHYVRLLAQNNVPTFSSTVSSQHWLTDLEAIENAAAETARLLVVALRAGPDAPSSISIHLNEDYSITIERTRGGSGVTWRLSREAVVLASIVQDELLKLCLPRKKWELENPGIMVAACLQKGFGIPFVDSGIIGQDGRYLERFQCYGPVRLVTDDVDEWYSTAKALALSAVNASFRSSSESLCDQTISFHYVEPVEANALFRTLNDSFSSSSAQELLLRWPHNGSEVGAYSRPVKSIVVARKLHSFLHRIRVRQKSAGKAG